jgi:hypothetical protein
MQNHELFTLFLTDGSVVNVRNYYKSSTARLADYLISDDGRQIYCQDEEQGLFWYADTQEKLYRDKPGSP